MPRSLKKGPYVHPSVMKHLRRAVPGGRTVIKTWARSSTITPEMIGFSFGVHNGRAFIEVKVMEDMVGHKFGEFSPTRKFIRHGGKMQRDIEQKGTTPSAAPTTPAKK